MQRGEAWWAALPQPKGSEPGYRRPVVLVQADPFNTRRIRTVIAAVVTSNLRLAAAPGNFGLGRKETGLPRQSVINVAQLVTLNKSMLVEKTGRLTASQLERLDEGLRLVLAL